MQSIGNPYLKQKPLAARPITLLVVRSFRCYNAHHLMADWKQITARIRRARTSKDPAGQLSNLYEKTQDAMVAFELARHFETAGLSGDAGKWYAMAAERFRRADWKTKALESAARLGAVPADSATAAPADQAVPSRQENAILQAPEVVSTVPEPGLPFGQNAEEFESVVAMSSEVQTAKDTEASGSLASNSPEAKRRRRGRRGGRNRRKAPGASGDGGTDVSKGDAVAVHRREPTRTSSRTGHVS